MNCDERFTVVDEERHTNTLALCVSSCHLNMSEQSDEESDAQEVGGQPRKRLRAIECPDFSFRACVALMTTQMVEDGDYSGLLTCCALLHEDKEERVVECRQFFDRAIGSAAEKRFFRFTSEDLEQLTASFGLPATIYTKERHSAPALECLSLVCERLASPVRYITITVDCASMRCCLLQ